MRNYEELTHDLLERRDCYMAEKKKKRKTVLRVGASLGCACLIGFGLWQARPGEDPVTEQRSEDALHIGIHDYLDESKGESPEETTAYYKLESPEDPVAGQKIVIHDIDGISSHKMNIALGVDDFVEMTHEEMVAYYGVDYTPVVPDDLKPVETEVSGIFRRENGTGAVYWDEDHLRYTNEDLSRNVSVSVDKGSYVFQCFWYFQGTEEKSVINNVEVVIGLTPDGSYYAEFLYKGVGFLLHAEGLTETEFVAVIASVIK